MDIQMPEMDGLTATKKIRETLNQVQLPIIAMTAHTLGENIDNSLAAGMNSYLCKPLEPELLYQILVQYLPPVAQSIKAPVQSSKMHNLTEQCTNEQAELIEQLQAIPEINCDQALVRMNGRVSLYLKLVNDFGSKQHQLHQTLMTLFEEQQWEQLYRQAHSLKSNAAYIGADNISVMAKAIESALAQQQYDNVTLIKLCHALQPLTQAISKIFESSLAGMQAQPYSPDLIKASLATLLPLLQKSDIEAEDDMPQLLQLCTNSPFIDDIKEMASYVNDVEYEKAAAVASRILAKL
jgi:CheY-like chemotaxis protein